MVAISDLPLITREKCARHMFAGRSAPKKMLSRNECNQGIIITLEGNIEGRKNKCVNVLLHACIRNQPIKSVISLLCHLAFGACLRDKQSELSSIATNTPLPKFSPTFRFL